MRPIPQERRIRVKPNAEGSNALDEQERSVFLLGPTSIIAFHSRPLRKTMASRRRPSRCLVAHGTHDSKRILKNRPLSREIASRPKCGRSFLLCFVPSVSLPSVPADYRSALGLIPRASAMLRFSTPHHSIMAAVMQSAKDSAHQTDSSEQPATVCSPTRFANRNVMPLTGS
jgi:hypothetical protein